MKKVDRKTMIANLQAIWPDAKLGKTSNEDLLFLAELVSFLPNNGKPTMSQTLQRYRRSYVKAEAYSGTASAHCGDDLAALLAGMTPAQVIELAERALDLEPGTLADRYSGLNPGQQRMNAGNRLRAALKKGTLTIEDLQ